MNVRLQKVYENILNSTPLIHNITNYVTVNDCANIELAFGGSPIMADDINEVEEIVSYANSLVINMGTLNKRTIESMKLAAKTANDKNIPVIFDPIGCGFTKLRRDFSKELVNDYKLAVIRGNLSEIMALINEGTKGKGVDVSEEDALAGTDKIIKYAKALASQLECVVIITGVDDVITDGTNVVISHNGHKQMSKVTGTGCMLSAMLGVSIGANHNDIFTSSLYAVSAMGLSGEKSAKFIADNNAGTSTLRTMIIDNVSNITAEQIIAEADYEIK